MSGPWALALVALELTAWSAIALAGLVEGARLIDAILDRHTDERPAPEPPPRDVSPRPLPGQALAAFVEHRPPDRLRRLPPGRGPW